MAPANRVGRRDTMWDRANDTYYRDNRFAQRRERLRGDETAGSRTNKSRDRTGDCLFMSVSSFNGAPYVRL